MNVAVLIPVLNRPARVEPLLETLAATEDALPFFICSPRDAAEINEVRRAGLSPIIVDWEPGPGDYAKKINYAFRKVLEQDARVRYVFLGADDLAFRPGWYDAALEVQAATNACVVGTNDLGNPRVKTGRHSTHTLVSVRYAECGTADDTTVLLHEGYDHNFCDTEFVETAMARETWAFAKHSYVEHLHPNWKKGEHDATYAKGEAKFAADRIHYQQRRHLWA